MNNPKLLKFLKSRHACKEGLVYVRTQPSLEMAWGNCERGDWMMYFAQQRNVDIKLMTAVKVKHARLVQHLMTDQRSLNALDVAWKFSRGEVSEETLISAASAAVDASVAAAAVADAAYANYVDAYVAYVAATAAAAVVNASDAAAAVNASDAAAAADADVRSAILSQCADICREMIPVELLRLDEFK